MEKILIWRQRMTQAALGAVVSLLGVFVGTKECWEVSWEGQWLLTVIVCFSLTIFGYRRFMAMSTRYQGGWVYPEYNLLQPLCFLSGVMMGVALGWGMCLIDIPHLSTNASWQLPELFASWVKWGVFFVGIFLAVHLGHIGYCAFWLGDYRH